MAFNYNKLKGRIVEKFGNQTKFAEVFGVSENTMSLKLNNKVRFTADDIVKIVKLLDIPAEEIGLYFFTQKVSKS